VSNQILIFVNNAKKLGWIEKNGVFIKLPFLDMIYSVLTGSICWFIVA